MTVPETGLLNALHVDRRKNDVEWRLLVISQIEELKREVSENLKATAELRLAVAETNTILQTLARMDERMSHMHADITKIPVEYVRKDRYMPVERVVLGLSAAVALGILSRILPKIIALI